jgi:hypothetical protein
VRVVVVTVAETVQVVVTVTAAEVGTEEG